MPDPVPSARQRLDRYEILAELASGGMATVYVARLPGAGGFERMVAIKRLHPHLEKEREFVEMFLDEARIAARIHHPNVVPTLEIGTSERGYYLVMDYVEGPTLARLLQRAAMAGERIPQRVVLKIVHDTLAGLHAAHELRNEDGAFLGLVHRDVSPQNVLVGVDGTSRITDFGVARAVSRLSSTRAGQLKGKLGYMSPEQARGDEIDRRADVFAVGVILWETLAGKRLFKGKSDTDAETLGRVLYSEIPNVRAETPDIPQALADVVTRGLQRDLSKRFATCADFIDALEHAANGQIATSREVAKYVEQVFGKELVDRRDAIRKLAPTSGPVPELPSMQTATGIENPLGLSSVSSASMSVADPRSSASIPSGPVPMVSAPPPRSTAVLIGGIVAAAVIAAAVAAGIVLAFRPGPEPAPAAASKTSETPVAPPATTSATPAITASATASASAEPPPSASAAPTTTHPASGNGTRPPVGGTGVVRPKGGGDGLSTNPYR